MPTYKIYDLTADGHIKGPPDVVSGTDDSDAIFAANEILDGSDKEIWHGARRVAVVKTKDDASRA